MFLENFQIFDLDLVVDLNILSHRGFERQHPAQQVIERLDHLVKVEIGSLQERHTLFSGFDLPNQGQVVELPRDAVVETMGLISHDNAVGLPVGPVPPAILTQLQRCVTLHEMTVEAALAGDRQLALQVLLNDPMCGAIRDFRLMEKMLDELLRANRRWLPQFFKR